LIDTKVGTKGTLKTIESRLRRTLKKKFWSRKKRKERKEMRRESPVFSIISHPASPSVRKT
jgi:hypothetical protein